MLSLYEILKASKTGIAPDMWTALAGMNLGGAGSGVEVKELTGIPPLSFRADGTPLLDYLISGNMSQTGTPTPTTPIQPQETGERTGNLCPTAFSHTGIVNDSGNTGTYQQRLFSALIPVDGNKTYSIKLIGESSEGEELRFNRIIFFDSSKTFISRGSQGAQTAFSAFTTPNNCAFISIDIRTSALTTPINESDITQIWMLEGTYTSPTMPPYEPYGIKIPISSGGENLFDMSFYEGKSGITVSGNKATGTCNRFFNVKLSIPPELYGQELTWSAFIKRPDNLNTARLQTVDNGSYKYGNSIIGEGRSTVSFTATSTIRLYINYANTGSDTIELSDITLNLGSKALPYEPYVQPTISNIYLGEVPTTRRIKKLVLKGSVDENITLYTIATGNLYRIELPALRILGQFDGNGICTHYRPVAKTADRVNGTISGGNSAAVQGFVDIVDDYESVDAFKAYLAQQYANGTPVTIWYVLATPTTGIVNEPLRKIGDYVDTISYEQAGVQIPTNRGNTVIDVETTLKPSEMYIKYQE